MLGAIMLALQAWSAQQYTVDALRCSELRVSYDVATGNVAMLRGEILPMSGGERVGSVRTYGFTLDSGSLPAPVATVLVDLREKAETWAENKTGWVGE